jgi:two-component system, cell cycle sensor histidine kinase and response regulator CckA
MPNEPPPQDFRLLFEKSPALLLVLDDRMRIVAVSNAYLAATMTNRESILGRDIFEVFPDNPADTAATGVGNLRASFARAIHSGKADTMAIQKYDIRRPDGSFEQRYWSPVNTPVYSPSGALAYIVHRVEDVTQVVRLTERREALENEVARTGQELETIAQLLRNEREMQQAFRASEERLRLLLDSAAEAIYSLDREGNCVFCNRACLDLLGYQTADVLGKNLHRLIHHTRVDGTPYPDHECPSHLAVRDRSAHHVQDEVLWRRNGTSFPVEYWAHPVIRDGEVVGSVVTFLDITERRSLELQLLHAQKMEAVGQLASGVAHDFNNMLNVISGYAELLADRFPAHDPGEEMLSEIQVAVRRATTLSHQLLTFSRKQVLQPVVIDLNHVCTEMEKMLRRLIGEDIQLNTRLEASLPSLKADRGQLEQVIVNLVVNARDAMPVGGHITIQTRSVSLDESYASLHAGVTPGDYVELSVSDTGTGMDAATQQRIFEPFFTTKEQGKGTGLGLAVVYGIVKQSAGHINVYSELGRGTAFRVFFPTTHDAPASSRHPAGAAAVGGSESILLVEDDGQLRAVGKAFLQARGYTVVDAANGAEALAALFADHTEFQLLITDVVMPGMSGSELAERVQDRAPAIRVLFMSGYTDDAMLRHGLELGRFPFIQKPFSLYDLAVKVREALHPPPGK